MHNSNILLWCIPYFLPILTYKYGLTGLSASITITFSALIPPWLRGSNDRTTSLVVKALVYLVSPNIPIISARCNCSFESNLSMPKVNLSRYSSAVLNFGSSSRTGIWNFNFVTDNRTSWLVDYIYKQKLHSSQP